MKGSIQIICSCGTKIEYKDNSDSDRLYKAERKNRFNIKGNGQYRSFISCSKCETIVWFSEID